MLPLLRQIIQEIDSSFFSDTINHLVLAEVSVKPVLVTFTVQLMVRKLQLSSGYQYHSTGRLNFSFHICVHSNVLWKCLLNRRFAVCWWSRICLFACFIWVSIWFTSSLYLIFLQSMKDWSALCLSLLQLLVIVYILFFFSYDSCSVCMCLSTWLPIAVVGHLVCCLGCSNPATYLNAHKWWVCLSIYVSCISKEKKKNI